MGRHLTLCFAWLALAICALVNPGNFGTIDTARRLQAERWMRLGEPPVAPAAAAEGYGVIGRRGVRHVPSGMGQSLVLLPFDVLVSGAIAPGAAKFGLDPLRREQITELLIAFLMQSLLTFAVLALAYRLLISFEYARLTAVAGALALLFATTCLQYVQCAQENLLLLALALGALWGIRQWQAEGRAVWALAAGASCGFAMLCRLSSFAETGVFALFAILFAPKPKRFLGAFAPPVAAALLLDRWYQWMRFGGVFGTYATAGGQHPMTYPFWKGFWGTLFSPAKSVFLFDPLLIVVLVAAAFAWRGLKRDLRLLLGALVLLLLIYDAGWARYFAFGGDVAWGHRYVLLPVELLCLFAVPLLMEHAKALPNGVRRGAWAVVCFSLVLQAASTAISPNAEIHQRENGDRHGVIWNRAVNLAQIATGHEDAQRFRRIPVEWRTLSYFPFQLRFRFPKLAAWAIAGWLVLLAVLPPLVWVTLLAARRAASASRTLARTGESPVPPRRCD